jgi:LPS-assembly protein
VRRGTFTTCEGDNPDWSFKFGDATVDLNDVVYGRDAAFTVRDIPVIPWIPFFAAAIRRERQTGFLFPEFGWSSRKGAYTRVPFYWAINDSQDATVAIDAYSRRGLGVEGEYRYIFANNVRGTFQGFLIPEVLRDDKDRERLNIPMTRGAFTYRHDWQVTPGLSFKIDANAVTDDLVYNEYGDRLADRGRQRAETNIFATQRWESWSLTGNILWYQDLTTPHAVELQRVPEFRLFGVRQQVPGAPWALYETEASFTNFHRVVGDSGVRADFHPRVFVPIPIAGLFTVTPFGGGRVTYYSPRAVGLRETHTIFVEQTVDDPHARVQAEGGVELETRASRVFQLDGWGGVSALQHLIEPRATFLMIRGINQKANPQYDPFIDKIGRVTTVTYSLTNRLNAKTMPGPTGEAVRWEAMRLTLAQTFDIDRAISNREPFRDLFGEFIFEPNPVFLFRSNVLYNVNGDGARNATADIVGRYRDFAASFGYRYDYLSATNFVVAEATGRVLRDVDVHAGVNWDVRHAVIVESRFGIDWRFQCFAISAEYVARHKNEDEFRFSVNLLGVGQVGSRLGTGQ